MPTKLTQVHRNCAIIPRDSLSESKKALPILIGFTTVLQRSTDSLFLRKSGNDKKSKNWHEEFEFQGDIPVIVWAHQKDSKAGKK